MNENLETTYYRFLSEVRAFLAKLKNNPINAEPSKYLKDRNFNKTKLINVLMKKGILERDEKILTPDKTGEKKVKYSVKYNIRKKDFETKIHRIYIKYFEKNEPEKEEMDEAIRECGITMGVISGGKPGETADRWVKYINDNENNFKRSVFKDEDTMKKAILSNPKDREAYEKRGGIKECEGADGGASTEGASTSAISNNSAPVMPVFGVQRREIMKKRDKDEKPENILGKTITAEGKKTRKIYITEEQYNMIMKEEGLGDAGAVGDYTANGLVLKTSDGKEDPCAKAGKINVKMIMDK